MRRRDVLKSALAAGIGLRGIAYGEGQAATGTAAEDAPTEDRAGWVAMLDRVGQPLFEALSQRRLKATMPVEAVAGEQQHRRQTTYLEALGRALAGMGPWLEQGATTGAEGELRARYCEWARAGIASAVDKGSPDYMDFGGDQQTIVDTAFLALGLSGLRMSYARSCRRECGRNLRTRCGRHANCYRASTTGCCFPR